MGEQVPIDITFSKLADWLVDRKRIPSDWRKRLLPIRTTITAALPSLPKDLDPLFSTLTSEATGYLEAKHIVNVLVAANPEARTLFGRHSGITGDWDVIVRAYEKDLLFLGEAAQIMIQTVNYDVPYLKKQITKLQQQLGDIERKEAEYKRSAAGAALKYQQACQELRINGVNIKAELLVTTKDLPQVFTEVHEVLCGTLVSQAVECYQAFVSYACTNAMNDFEALVPTLSKLQREHAESFHEHFLQRENVAVDRATSNLDAEGDLENLNCVDITGETGRSDIDHNIRAVENFVEFQQEQTLQQKLYADPIIRVGKDEKSEESLQGGIDQNTGDVGKDDQSGEVLKGGIDWNTGSVNDEQLGDDLQGSIDWNTGDVEGSTDMASAIQWDISSADHLDMEDPGIEWDISIEDGAGDLGSAPQPPGLENQEDGQEQAKVMIPSKFMETEYRNSLLNDLLEIRAFLALKSEEMKREETSALQNQVQAISPQELQQYGNETLQAMGAEVSKAISLLTDKRTRDLLMIATSQRFLKRLETSLLQKKQQESKLLESLKELGEKQLELRSTLAATWPKQEGALQRIRAIKEHCEKTLSNFYEGRRVNIIGEINSVLGQA